MTSGLRPGQVHVHHGLLDAGRRAATILALVVVAWLALDQRYGWLRHRPGGEAFDVVQQPVFMALFALGALLALRWRLLGGTLAAFTSAGLVVFAGRQFEPLDAGLVVVGFAVPAVIWIVVGLFELRDEQFHRDPDEPPRQLLRRRDVLGGGAALGVTLLAGAVVGRWLFDRLYGPTHPSSTVAAVRGSATRWVWSGAVTSSSAAVTCRLEDDDLTEVALLVARSESLRDGTVHEALLRDEGLVRVDLDGLDPASEYHYAFVVEGEVDRTRVGRFRTHPTGPASLNLLIGCCARTGSNAAVFDTMRSLDPDLVVFDGDFHYADITRNDQLAYRRVLDHTLSRPAQEALLMRYPVAYVWDDHDFGGPDASVGSRPAAMASYRRYVPHHPLASESSAVHQSFSFGRVRIVLTDARSDRRPQDGDVAGTMLGPEQKAWLLDELLDARDSHALTLWVNPVPWIETPSVDGDGWGGFAAERAEIAAFIAEHDIAPSLVMLSGDAHMLAIDDGSNSDYSPGGGAGFPVFHAGALDRPGSVKGGPYSHGTFPGGGQFGQVTVDDDGETVAVTLTGRNWRNEIVVEHSLTV
ncbi:MAG: alkaline phosphatase D family protein [Actinomycetota bacterium]